MTRSHSVWAAVTSNRVESSRPANLLEQWFLKEKNYFSKFIITIILKKERDVITDLSQVDRGERPGEERSIARNQERCEEL